MDRLKNKHYRDSTKNTYYKIWQHFNMFFIRLDSKPRTWEERLVLFLGYLVDIGRKSSTVQSYISAIKLVLCDDGEIINENIYLLKALMQACKYENDQVKICLPIKKGLLCMLLDEINKLLDQQPYLCCLYRAIFITGYFGLLRIGELTSGPHVVKACDVHLGRNKNKMMFVLHTSKTH